MPTSFTAATVRPLAPSAVANETNGSRRPLGAEAGGRGGGGGGGAGGGAGGPPQPASRPIRPSAAIHADLIARLPAGAVRAARLPALLPAPAKGAPPPGGRRTSPG